MSEDEFVAVVTEGQPTAPGYFLFNATLNKQERDVRQSEASIPALNDDEIAAAIGAGAVIHDARPAADFSAGHLRGAVSVPVDGRMAETAGMVFTPEQRLVLIAPAGAEQETATRLARIGYDNVVGYVPDPEAYLERHADQVAQASRLRICLLYTSRCV